MKIIHKSKNGIIQMQIIALFVTVLVLGVVFLPWLFKIQKMGSDLQFEKKFIAVDMGKSFDAMHTVLGNAYLLYTGLGNFNLSYSLGQSIIEVFEGKDKAKDGAMGKYPFTEDGPEGIFLHRKDLIYSNKTISSVFISKQGKEMFFDSPALNPKFRANLNYLPCPRKASILKSILLDPGDGWDAANKKGSIGHTNQNENITESEITIQLANIFSGLLSRVAAIDKTRDFAVDSHMPMAQRASSAMKSDSIISIHLGSSPDPTVNNALAYFNVHSMKKEESISLGCNILNAVSDAFPQITGLAFVPVNLDNELKADSESRYSILLDDKVAVLLEIGNIQKPGMLVVRDSQIELAKAVLNGVERYHGIR